MTITERNQRLFELRHKLGMKRAEVKMVEQEIQRVRDEYDREQFARKQFVKEQLAIPGNSLYDQMFSN